MAELILQRVEAGVLGGDNNKVNFNVLILARFMHLETRGQVSKGKSGSKR